MDTAVLAEERAYCEKERERNGTWYLKLTALESHDTEDGHKQQDMGSFSESQICVL